MGVVVAATHLELGHRVAIKFLRDEMARNAEVVERFLREARAVVHLKTEHVCRVTDVGRTDDGAPYIVMELLQGSDLQKAVAKHALPLTTAVEYVMQACIAVAEAHHAGIIHRDLKPANLFVTRRFDGGPLVKVLDFGIAKALTETSQHITHQSAMGSPGYMSPEQLHSARDVDLRTDIWALGVTLYQLLSARLPFDAHTATEIAIRVASDPPAPLDVDPALGAIIWRCLEKERTRRYASVKELGIALVPFGGPSARRHAAELGQIGSMAFDAPPPVVAPGLATAATGFAGTAMSAAAAPPRQMTPLPSPPSLPPQPPHAPPRRQWPLIAISLGILGIAGIALAAAIAAGKSTQVAQVSHDAAVVAPPLPDAAAIVATPIDAAPQEAPVDAAPRRARPRPDAGAPRPDASAPRPDAGSPAQPVQPVQQPEEEHGFGLGKLARGGISAVKNLGVNTACTVATKTGVAADTVTPAMVTCMCRKKDRAGAEKAYAHLTESRGSVRADCAKSGVKLSE